MEKNIREIKVARGILIHQDKVLLVRCTRPGEGHYFLPGGRVEPGESALRTLAREWQEELGWSVAIEKFIGCVEAHWDYSRKTDGAKIDVFEVDFVFKVTASQERLLEVKSLEPDLEFHWVPINEVQSANILPLPMKQIIFNLLVPGDRAVWESTF